MNSHYLSSAALLVRSKKELGIREYIGRKVYSSAMPETCYQDVAHITFSEEEGLHLYFKYKNHGVFLTKKLASLKYQCSGDEVILETKYGKFVYDVNMENFIDIERFLVDLLEVAEGDIYDLYKACGVERKVKYSHTEEKSERCVIL